MGFACLQSGMLSEFVSRWVCAGLLLTLLASTACDKGWLFAACVCWLGANLPALKRLPGMVGLHLERRSVYVLVATALTWLPPEGTYPVCSSIYCFVVVHVPAATAA